MNQRSYFGAWLVVIITAWSVCVLITPQSALQEALVSTRNDVAHIVATDFLQTIELEIFRLWTPISNFLTAESDQTDIIHLQQVYMRLSEWGQVLQAYTLLLSYRFFQALLAFTFGMPALLSGMLMGRLQKTKQHYDFTLETPTILKLKKWGGIFSMICWLILLLLPVKIDSSIYCVGAGWIAFWTAKFLSGLGRTEMRAGL